MFNQLSREAVEETLGGILFVLELLDVFANDDFILSQHIL